MSRFQKPNVPGARVIDMTLNEQTRQKRSGPTFSTTVRLKFTVICVYKDTLYKDNLGENMAKNFTKNLYILY